MRISMRSFILSAIAIGLCAAQRPQQQGFNAMGGQAPPPQPLDQVLLQVFDKDNSDDDDEYCSDEENVVNHN